MEIKTVSYSSLGHKFYFKKAFQSIPMDEHIASMVSQGWTVTNGPMFVPGKKQPGLIGSQMNRGSMFVTYQKS